MAFPGLIRALALLQALFFVVLIFNPKALDVVFPDINLVMDGQVWRLFSFVLLPPILPPAAGGSLVFPALIMFITVRLFYLFNDVLEQAWGPTRTSIYVYAVIICQGLLSNVFPVGIDSHMYYLAIFFAFATILPDYTFLLMFVLPVKVWILAALAGVGILLRCFSAPILFGFYAIAYLPYLIWAIPHLWKWRKLKSRVTHRRNRFQADQSGGTPTLHRCETCNRTEISDPNLEFRVAEDDNEYCLDHLP
ncbi:MAG: hypothetical protein ACSHYF_08880 [Verrucomicrobiaceae bacterium]